MIWLVPAWGCNYQGGVPVRGVVPARGGAFRNFVCGRYILDWCNAGGGLGGVHPKL